MATQEAAENPLKPIKNKTWILRTSIHCEGCKRKVKKILDQVHGVENVDIDIKQQKVIVTGNVKVDSLIKKLKKSGKNAELWPEKTEKKEKNSVQERNKEKQIKRQNNEQNDQRNGVKKEQKPMGNVEAVQDPAKTSDGGASTSGSIAKSGEGSVGAAQVDAGDVKSDEKIDAGGSVKVSEGLVKTTGGVQVAESKLEKKPEPESSSANARPPPPAKEEKGDSENKSGVASENNNGGSDSVETHTSGKKKKKQGQNSNNMERAKSSAATPASTGSDKHRGAGQPPISIPANHIPPRQHNYHDYPTPLHRYGPPPVYTVSHNTTYPTSSYTASYSAPPPHSYVYTYSGREVEPPPPSYSDSYPPQPPPFNADSYPRQPLDSFEMFSDENPNGCFIM
ncbi:heavy metal-associated isoprenylated plant 3-like [Olea europaea subsp. europaea]|uniref:Heavy metal-associated isoprenylated plant 3-like n=1 Tax=Olea europaea subsp. europaea TaxID=158383 RepID=A0A8S0UV69_OLEEU|nr:heavy metal-associated isoprenylated plant 3-like [Olea europaea subsp. europaea]